MSHEVEGPVEGFLLSYEPLVHLERAYLVIWVLPAGNLVDLLQIILELSLGGLGEGLAVLDALFDLHYLLVNSARAGQVKSLTHEGVANPDDLLSQILSLLEHHDIDCLLLLRSS